MPVIALDLSKHVGWAVDSEFPGIPQSGVWDLPGAIDDYGAAGLELSTQLARLVLIHKPRLIVYERPLDPRNLGDPGDKPVNPVRKPRKRFMASFETIRLLIGLPMIVETLAKRHGVECQEAFTASWRSHFCGTMKGGKEPTKARCVQLRWPFRDDNQADALGIWEFAKATTDPRFRPMQGRDS